MLGCSLVHVGMGNLGASARRAAVFSTGPVEVLATGQSNNWSGYDQGVLSVGHMFSQASAAWTVPTATQAVPGQAEDAATWVGIGGGCMNSSCSLTDPTTLIQAGTSEDVSSSGQVAYYAWYETLPEPEIPIAAMTVSAGDKVSVNILQHLPGQWYIFFRNFTNGAQAEIPIVYPSDMLTAEWIEESPLVISSTSTTVAPLPKLTTVTFSAAMADGTLANLQANQAIDLVSANGDVIAYPSAPVSGSAFNVCVDPSGYLGAPTCPLP